MTTDLSVHRKNMIDNLIKFLFDDCYVYIMTIGFNGYNSVANKNDFYTFKMYLSHEFQVRITNIYKEIGEKDPSEKVNLMYYDVVLSTVRRIQSENHPFSIGVNKIDNSYEIVFLSKKIETVNEAVI